MKEQYRIIISGGGTGGHIFPAISIANTFRKRFPDAEILFVGAEDRMEMEKVPAAGYEIVGLPVSGFDRAHLLNNIKRCSTVCVKASDWRRRRSASFVRTLQWEWAAMPVARRCGWTASLGIPTLDTGAELLCRSNQ